MKPVISHIQSTRNFLDVGEFSRDYAECDHGVPQGIREWSSQWIMRNARMAWLEFANGIRKDCGECEDKVAREIHQEIIGSPRIASHREFVR